MLLIKFWGLNAKLTMLSGGCEFGISKVNNFYSTKVGISILTRFIKQELKLLFGFYVSFVFSVTKS